MSESLIIRPAGEADRGAIVDLLEALTNALANDGIPFRKTENGKAISSFVANERGCVLLAEDETGTLGLVTASFNLALRYDGEYAQVEELIVTEAARGKGVGGKLVCAVIEAARERGCIEVGLYAVPRNQPFYEKMGFSYAGPDMRMTLG
ncbi:MAG: GNAT family N-acetyltransferase [Pseudomonadota bacterium]